MDPRDCNEFCLRWIQRSMVHITCRTVIQKSWAWVRPVCACVCVCVCACMPLTLWRIRSLPFQLKTDSRNAVPSSQNSIFNAGFHSNHGKSRVPCSSNETSSRPTRDATKQTQHLFGSPICAWFVVSLLCCVVVISDALCLRPNAHWTHQRYNIRCRTVFRSEV